MRLGGSAGEVKVVTLLEARTRKCKLRVSKTIFIAPLGLLKKTVSFFVFVVSQIHDRSTARSLHRIIVHACTIIIVRACTIIIIHACTIIIVHACTIIIVHACTIIIIHACTIIIVHSYFVKFNHNQKFCSGPHWTGQTSKHIPSPPPRPLFPPFFSSLEIKKP